MSLESLLKFGYFLITITITLMIWASLARASSREIEQMKYPPCTYNPLCTCSKAAPDLGIVHCKNVPFPAIPKMVNNSKVFMLHMENTGLREIEPYFLQATGMYRLKISNNHLTEIPDDAFTGLERSLWELILPNNELIEIPSKSFRHLQKLRHLDLSYNYITFIGHDSFRGLEDSLQTLVLKENSITVLPPHGFSGLLLLETLDLSGNNLYEIDPSVFKDGMPRLSKLLLTDNVLTEFPYNELAPLKMLRTLDLSHNAIRNMITNDSYGGSPKTSVKFNLDNLHMEYNQIDQLQQNAFMNFDVVNRTFFDGNPIRHVMDDAFKPAKIREIYMRYCGLTIISPVAFDSLVNSLQILDLSGNNLTNLPEKVFNNFDFLRVLSLRDNKIKIIAPVEMFNVFQYTLLKLDLSGDKNAKTNLQELKNMTRMRNMRSLSISQLNTQVLKPEEFLDFSTELEDLQITRGGLQSINAHAFKYVRGIKRLDLSENSIGTIENEAFTEIGHSLISLKISHGYSGSSLPSDALRHLTSLQELDFSNNKISSMSDTSFHFLKNLRLLELHDNRIEQVMKGTFQGDIHSKLEEISFRFNNLKTISQHTFFDLEALQKLHLDDNKIEKIERRAFMNLDRLEHLSLRGNKLTSLTDESFQLYESDPLPKNICEKCMYNVNVIFTESQKIFKVQKKWIDNVRTNKPKHSFVYALDLIEQTNRKMVEDIKNIVPDFIHRPARPVADLKEVQNSIEATENTDLTTPLPAPKNCISLMTNCNEVDSQLNRLLMEPEPISKTQFSMDYDPFTVEKKPTNVKTQKVPPASNTQQKIKEIRNKLQSNGCTLMSLNQAHPPPIVPWTKKTPTLSSILSIHCKYCLKTFPNIKFLAKHQLGHLVLSDRRIFDRKYLEKKVRRGRLIPVGDKKCIRCLNCWKLFVDNRAILDHWSKGDCDFFCNVCGQEFPTNPRMLREHVKGTHGISYKSSRRRVVESEKFMLRDLYNKTATPYDPHSSGNPLVQVKLEPGEIPNGPSKAKRKKQGLNSQGRVSCNICFCTFPNFQSKNSHMRKHKKREIPSATVSREIRTERPATNSLVEKNAEQLKLPPEIKVEPEEGYEILMEFSTDCQLKAEGPKFFTPILQNCSASSSLCTTPPSPAAGTSPSTSVPRLQVKKLSDLQDPCISSQNHDEDAPEFKFTPPKSTATPKTTANASKSSTKTDDHMDYKRLYNCHPCGQKFSSKTELFQHKRQCQSNNKFTCRFCLRAFVTSADLQLHIMIMHKAI